MTGTAAIPPRPLPWHWIAGIIVAVALLAALPAARGFLWPQESLSDRIVRALPDAIPEAARAGSDAARASVESELDRLFDPAHAAVVPFADAHYSLIGQYTELVASVTGSLARDMEADLFAGFDARLAETGARIDLTFDAAYRQTLTDALGDRLATTRSLPAAAAIDLALGERRQRFAITLAAGSVGSAIAGRAGARIASELAAKALARTAGRLAAGVSAKELGIGASATAGALVGSFAGPVGTAVGGVVGAAAAWIATDVATLKLDEYLNRDGFEAELHALIDAERERVRTALFAAIGHRAALAGATVRDARLAARALD
jgi:hypothetical protein